MLRGARAADISLGSASRSPDRRHFRRFVVFASFQTSRQRRRRGGRMAAENKTKPTGADVGAFLDAVPDPKRRADGKEVAALMERLSGEAPYMWGPTVVGFGNYHYKY